MPPQRTTPPARVLKAGRTHEENQERAYIAASRRSDRSLVARVESARKASEIHKDRTGRCLRVTEQDVVNEEVYEEEFRHLPTHYPQFTAQLQTGSSDFNRRLSAYLTKHVAVRSALDHAVTDSYAAQFPNAPRFAHNLQSRYPSPFKYQSMPQQQSPKSDRPDTYFSEETESTSQLMQSKAVHAQSSMTLNTRQKDPAHQRGAPYPSSRQQPSFKDMEDCSSIDLFNSSLSPESEISSESALDPDSPKTAMLVAEMEHLPMLSKYDSSSESALQSLHHSYDSMNATIAPCALDKSPGQQNHSQSTISLVTPRSTELYFGDAGQIPSASEHSGGNSATWSGTFTSGDVGAWDYDPRNGFWFDNII